MRMEVARPFRPRFGSCTSLLLYSAGENLPRFKGRENRLHLHLLMGVAKNSWPFKIYHAFPVIYD